MSSPAAQPNANTATQALLAQLCLGPSFLEVAAALLRPELRRLYPALDIDPDIAMVCTPGWVLMDDQIQATTPQYQTLTGILARQAVLEVPRLYIEGEHFLTQQPLTTTPIHLPVRIAEIAQVINVLAPVMLSAYQEQQIAFWNSANKDGPQWHTLSNHLRTLWNVQGVTGWSAVDCAMARQLYNAPDLKSRQAKPLLNGKAYLIDISLIEGETVTPLSLMPIAVLVGTHESRTVILVHSLLNGYEKFTSLQQLGASLPGHLNPGLSYTGLHWRLLEPEGDFFDQQACSLITLQINAIGAIDFSALKHKDANPAALGSPPAIASFVADQGPDLSQYQDAMPAWLNTASSSDLSLYSRHLKDLAALHSLNAGKGYQDGIAPIREYTLKTLKDLMVADHAEAATLHLDDIEIRVTSQVVWGTFPVPGKIEMTTFNLVDLALQNLIALPLGDKSLRLRNARALPAWLTVSYVETLVQQADIGRQYPALVKAKLLDDPQESLRRQQLYGQHLRIQLPLLALQYKIRQQAGIDERGYRYIVAVLESQAGNRQVDGQTIVLRPLAFVPLRRAGGAADEVANMFLIGPQDPSAGPCLLYRPLFDQPLTQYPSPANVLYALQEDADLRDSVLAWLPDAVRSDYSNYVFPGALPSPWAIMRFIVEPSKLWVMCGPMRLGGEAINDDLAAHLFKANANAVVELADRQSVSNRENRWATFKQAGWLIFNAALPFLGRGVGVAAWIWQILDQLQQAAEARRRNHSQQEWAALTDVLLNLAMAITLHLASRNQPASRRLPGYQAEKKPAPPTSTPTAPIIQQGPTILPHELPPELPQSVYSLGAVARKPETLATVLERFKLPRPSGLGNVVTPVGPHQYLYPLGEKWYAPVGERWFEVQVGEDDAVVIVDPSLPTRTGPLLLHNLKGEWFVDTRLRLRGGGPKVVKNKAQKEATRKAAEVRARLEQFENDKQRAQLELQQARQALSDAPGTSAQAARQLYLDKLVSQRNDYETALQQLKTLNLFAPMSNYQPKALSYLKAQLDLTQAGIAEVQTRFTPKLRTVLDQIERQATAPQERHIEDARQMTELSQDMLTRLDYAQSRFTELKALARDGLRLIQSTRHLLPSYSSDDLKALQVTMARNLCLSETSLQTHPQAWSTLDRIVDAADLAVQTLRDTLHERSESRLDERIDSLGSLIDQFKVIDERLQDFSADFSEHALGEPLGQLRAQIRSYLQRTLNSLALLHAERDLIRTRPTPPPTPPRPLKKFISTRFNGVLIGEPRLTEAGLETNMVDIRSPLTHNVLATFHEKQPGIWVQHVKASVPAPAPDLETSLHAGETLLLELPAFNRRAAEQVKKPDRTVVGIEQMFHQHAMLLEQAEQDLERVLTNANVTDSDSNSAASLSSQLNNAAQSLYLQAKNHRIQTTKQRPPTIDGVEWLKTHNEITVRKTITRRRLKAAQPDYLDEYTISEQSSGKVLWYAHLHYSTSWTPPKAFISARLKTPEEARRGSAADSTGGLNEQQLTDFYRSEFGLEQARRVFFDAG